MLKKDNPVDFNTRFTFPEIPNIASSIINYLQASDQKNDNNISDLMNPNVGDHYASIQIDVSYDNKTNKTLEYPKVSIYFSYKLIKELKIEDKISYGLWLVKQPSLDFSIEKLAINQKVIVGDVYLSFDIDQQN